MAIKHQLEFVTSGHGKKEIQEPVGFDGADFTIQQEENRKGRDVFYAGGNIKLKIYKKTFQHFDILKYNLDRYGFEAVIRYIISFDGVEYTVGELADIVTDETTYIEFTIVEVGERALFKARLDVKTNLLSNETLDGEEIEPVTLHNVYVKAKPIVQKSEWEWTLPELNENFIGYGQDFAFIAPYPTLKTFGIKDSAPPFEPYQTTVSLPPASELERIADETTVIRAATNLKDVKISLKGINLQVSNTGLFVTTRIRVNYGTSYTIGQFQSQTLFTSSASIINLVNKDYEFTIPFVNETTKIWIQISVSQPFSAPGATPVSNTNIQYSGGTMNISATSIAKDSVVPMVRLIDAMRYNAKSTANLDVSAPHWEEGGEYYNQFITSQALMRLLTDKPFYIETKGIVEDYLPEVNGDYQMLPDNTVFYGRGKNEDDDFYRNYEIANFTKNDFDDEYVGLQGGQIEGFQTSFNPRFSIKSISYSNKIYASQKEETEENTYDIVHGMASFLTPNKKGLNKKDISFGWVRDAYSWEDARRKSYDISDTAATPDDDKIYILDVVPLSDADRTNRETSLIKQDQDEALLVLTNDQSFSWVQLGIVQSTPFKILNGNNTGEYIVYNVTPTVLTLIGGDPESQQPINLTFEYYVDPFVTTLVNRTNEGFQRIENLSEGTNYSNLNFTVKRNILNYYQSYLATACLYHPNEVMRLTEYKNNPDAITQLTTETEAGSEGVNFIPSTTPILSPLLKNVNIVMTLQDFFNLDALQRTERGFITTMNADGTLLKGYIKSMTTTVISKGGLDGSELICKAEAQLEEKYTPIEMTITAYDDTVIINGEIAPSGFTYDIVELKLSIFDEVGRLLHNPTYYDKVTINGVVAESVKALGQALQSIKG